MGRGRVKGQRTKSGRLSRAKASLLERNPPADYILERRELFAWHRPTKGPDGRVGEIDQDICDGIGQLHALGLLDGHGLDAQNMRDAGRLYAQLYWRQYPDGAPRVGEFEQSSRGCGEPSGLDPRAEAKFNRMEDSMASYDRAVLMSLVCDTLWGDEIVPWAQSLIDHGLAERKKFRRGVVRFATADDWARLMSCVRALCAIVDGGMEMRRAA